MMKVKFLFLTVLIVFSMCSCNKPISQENKVNITLLHGFGGESKEDIIMRKIYKEFASICKENNVTITDATNLMFTEFINKYKK